jgi:hypothetical protein
VLCYVTPNRLRQEDLDIHADALFAKDEGSGQRCGIRRDKTSDVIYSRIELPKM